MRARTSSRRRVAGARLATLGFRPAETRPLTHRRMGVVSVVLIFCSLALLQAGSRLGLELGQGTGATTSSLGGVVWDPSRNGGVSAAIVRLVGTNGYRANSLTNRDGYFLFSSLATDASYELNASKTGFLSTDRFTHTGFGAAGMIVWLTPGVATTVRLPMFRPAAITGLVRDADGSPAPDVTVQTLIWASVRGARRIVDGPRSTTDGAGRYSVQDLVPGEYLVLVASTPEYLGHSSVSTGVRVRSAGRSGLPDMMFRSGQPILPVFHQYYPAADQTEGAQSLFLSSGQVLRGIDLQVRPFDGVRVSGTVTGVPTDQTVRIRLVQTQPPLMPRSTDIAVARVASDGVFQLASVPPGSYRLLIAPGDADVELMPSLLSSRTLLDRTYWSLLRPIVGSPPLLSLSVTQGQKAVWLSERIQVADKDLEMSLHAHKVVSLRGVVRTDSPGSSVPSSVFLEPSPQNEIVSFPQLQWTGRSEPGRFVVSGLTPGVYYFSSTSREYAVTQTVLGPQVFSNGRIDIDSGVDGGDLAVTLSRTGDIGGVVTGNTNFSTAVACYPVGVALRQSYAMKPTHMKAARLRPDKTFSIDGLPQGEYYCAAFDTDWTTSWEDIDRLAGGVNASRVVVVGGKRASTIVTR